MKNYFFCFIFLLGSSMLYAQERPPYLPEDVETKSLVLNEFAILSIQNKSRSRGISLGWQTVAGSELVSEGDSPAPDAHIDQISRFFFKGKAPLLLKDRVRVLLGYTFLSEKYTFGALGDQYNAVFQHLDGKNLKSQQFSLYANQTISARSYLNLRLRTAYNGDYGAFLNFDSKYQVFSATALYGMKRSEKLEWGLGVNLSKSFRRTIVLPVLMYNFNFNEKFGVEMILPALVWARWNVKQGTMLFAGAQYNSRSYGIDVSDTESYGMNHSEIQFPVRLEQKIYAWFWLGVQAGYQYNFSTDFDSDKAMSFAVEPKSSPYFQLAIFFSPDLENK